MVPIGGVAWKRYGTPHAHAQEAQAGTATWHVKFSPRGGCTDMTVTVIRDAKESIKLMGYGFTSKPIAEALIAAQKRGVKVELVLDKSNRTDRYGLAKHLFDSGAKVYIDGKHAIMHNKVMIFDGKSVLTGSFNWTTSAEERNAENLILLHDKALAKVYGDNFDHHKAHAEEWKERP